MDTQALILAGRGQLPGRAAEAFLAETNRIWFSMASLWEIGIKASLGKLEFHRNLVEYRDLLIEDLGLNLLSIEAHHLERTVHLPWFHKDPFDRLLIGQALEEGLTVLGSDEAFERYGCGRIWS